MVSALMVLAILSGGHPEGCGRERHAVKTLRDAEAQTVSTEPKNVTIEELVALPAPLYREGAPREAAEKKTYAVAGRIVAFKEESGDGDFHVVVAGDSGATIIVELPNPDCAQGSVFAERMARARQRFIEQFGQPIRGVFRRLHQPPRVRVVGVGFFDRIHGQRGVAPNGIELHPVLSIDKLAD